MQHRRPRPREGLADGDVTITLMGADGALVDTMYCGLRRWSREGAHLILSRSASLSAEGEIVDQLAGWYHAFAATTPGTPRTSARAW